MKRKILLLIMLIATTIVAFAQSDLKFNNGTFKIAQFTDLHWSDKSPKCEETTNTIKSVLEIEKPDLAILTGDVVTAPPAKDGWLRIAKIFEEAQIPWTVVLGNHDAEADLTREGIFDVIEKLPFFVGEKGENLTGAGNFVLPVYNDKEEPTALIYCLDSHNKPDQNKLGHYDWIRFDQIAWYRQMSDSFTKINNKPIPAVAFFHIPILEFDEIQDKESTIGFKMERGASPDINSGIFASFVEKKDVMGLFVGHNHNNDYIGLHFDIAMAFGRTTGADAYGVLERGARIIQLYEGDFRFDSWIRTPSEQTLMYYFPSGISSVDEENIEVLPALEEIESLRNGLHYTYYEGGSLRHTSDIAKNGRKVKEGIVDNFTLEPAMQPDSIAFEYEGYIRIPERGIYNFYTFSDDGSVLYIDDQVVVDNDGSHSLRRVDSKVGLEKGLHKIKVVYFENYMGEYLEVGWSSRKIREETIPDHVLFTK